MNAAMFRVVYFVIDPFLDYRIPIGAVILVNGAATLLRYDDLATASRVAPAILSTIKMVLDDLRHLPSFEAIPASVGPQVVYGGPIRFPESWVADPMTWVLRQFEKAKEKHWKGTVVR